MVNSSYTPLEDYEGSREDIAAVQAPIQDPSHATKVDPVTGKTVTDREAEAAAVDDIVAKAQRYVERTGEATPKAERIDGEVWVTYRSDEETDEAFMSDEHDRAKAYEEGHVDPIEGLIALEESDDPLLQDHDAKAMRDAQEERDSDAVGVVANAWAREWDRQDGNLYPHGLSVPQATRLAGLAVDAIKGQE